jgi:ribonuclease E
MADSRNQRIVERKLRDQLKVDRARVQLGRISPFGLLELSRQRLRPSFQELSAQSCPTCHGSGIIRSVESAALQALRAIELTGMKGGAATLAISLPIPVALYVLNQKRDRLIGLEQRYQIRVDVRVDATLVAGEYRVEATELRPAVEEAPTRVAERAEVAPVAAGAAGAGAGASGRVRARWPRRRRRSSMAGRRRPTAPNRRPPWPAPRQPISRAPNRRRPRPAPRQPISRGPNRPPPRRSRRAAACAPAAAGARSASRRPCPR